MSEDNSSTVITEFIFVDLTTNPTLEIILFLVFLAFYMSSLAGNLGMIVLIRASPRLHTPMYSFLCNLSLLDMFYSSVIAPKALVNILADKKSISLIGCALQMYFFIGLGSTECFMLTVMAYDRYVAICKPLIYPVLMSPRFCISLVFGSYVLGLLHSLVHTVFTFRLPFCESNKINNFLYCDITAILSLSCSDTYINELLIFYVAGLVEVTTILSVLVSYIYILTKIVRMSSVAGRLKAFSTCTAHLTAVTIFHGAILILHFSSNSRNRSFVQGLSDKVLSVFYTIVIPLLNPLIYSLRNKEVKDALGVIQRKIYGKIICCNKFQ